MSSDRTTERGLFVVSKTCFASLMIRAVFVNVVCTASEFTAERNSLWNPEVVWRPRETVQNFSS